MHNDSGQDPAQVISALHAKGVAIDYGADFRMMVMKDDLARVQRQVDALSLMDRMVAMNNVSASLGTLVPRHLAGEIDKQFSDTIYQDLMIWHCLKQKGVQ